MYNVICRGAADGQLPLACLESHFRNIGITFDYIAVVTKWRPAGRIRHSENFYLTPQTSKTNSKNLIHYSTIYYK